MPVKKAASGKKQQQKSYQERVELTWEEAKALSDQKIRFVLDNRSNRIHDKHCRFWKTPGRSVTFLDHYISLGTKKCPACERRALVSIGAEDPENYHFYEEWLENANVSTHQLHTLYNDLHAKTSCMYDILTIKVKEDTWRLILVPNQKGRVKFLHNNYRIRNNSRDFVGGFHNQTDDSRGIFFTDVLRQISRYKPEVHYFENMIPEGFSIFIEGDGLIKKFHMPYTLFTEEYLISTFEALDVEYPEEEKLILVLTKGFASTTKRVQAFLDMHPDRFGLEYA